MAQLYVLAENYLKFNRLVEDALDNEETTEDDLQMFIDTLDGINDAIEIKVENIVKFLKNIESDIEGYKKEEKRLASRRKTLENKFDGLKNYMGDMLQMVGKKSVKAGMFTVKFQKNPSSVEVLSERDVPAEYREPQPDKILKKSLLAHLKEGKQIAGVLLVEDKEHLRIT